MKPGLWLHTRRDGAGYKAELRFEPPHGLAGAPVVARGRGRTLPLACGEAAAVAHRMLPIAESCMFAPPGSAAAIGIVDRMAYLAHNRALQWDRFRDPTLRQLGRRLAERRVSGGPVCLLGADSIMGWNPFHSIEKSISHLGHEVVHTLKKYKNTIISAASTAAATAAAAVGGPLAGAAAAELTSAITHSVVGNDDQKKLAQQALATAAQAAQSNPAIAQALDAAHGAVNDALSTAHQVAQQAQAVSDNPTQAVQAALDVGDDASSDSNGDSLQGRGWRPRAPWRGPARYGRYRTHWRNPARPAPAWRGYGGAAPWGYPAPYPIAVDPDAPPASSPPAVQLPPAPPPQLPVIPAPSTPGNDASPDGGGGNGASPDGGGGNGAQPAPAPDDAAPASSSGAGWSYGAAPPPREFTRAYERIYGPQNARLQLSRWPLPGARHLYH